MLKTVSSITNAIGALNYKGTWNASTNSPALASGAGTKGDYYVVSVAGTTSLDGISNWGVGDWATFNGSVWQRVEGGADLNGVNLSVSGTSTLSGLTASTALALNASKEIVSVTNTGSGNNVLATSPVLTTPNIGAATGASVNLTQSVTAGSSVTAGQLQKLRNGSFTAYNAKNFDADVDFLKITFDALNPFACIIRVVVASLRPGSNEFGSILEWFVSRQTSGAGVTITEKLGQYTQPIVLCTASGADVFLTFDYGGVATNTARAQVDILAIAQSNGTEVVPVVTVL